MSTLIENLQQLLSAVPVSYLLALLGLLLLLLILLIARQGQKYPQPDNVEAVPSEDEPIEPVEAEGAQPSLAGAASEPMARTTPIGTEPELIEPIEAEETHPVLETADHEPQVDMRDSALADEPTQPVAAGDTHSTMAKADHKSPDKPKALDAGDTAKLKTAVTPPVEAVTPEPLSSPQAPPDRIDDTPPEPEILDKPAAPEIIVEKPAGLFTRLKKGLTKTRQFLNTDIDRLFCGGKKIDDDLLEELEELLITADIGVQTALDLIDRISTHADDINDADQLKNILKTEISALLEKEESSEIKSPQAAGTKPHVIMMVGVNGVGKTTTIGKLAAHYASENKKVLIAAADTFRAAAVEQVNVWAQRSNAELVRHKDGSDPAAVAFDGVEAAIARECDVVLIDTAGRLHTKINLMEELKKIKRSVDKKLNGAPHEILLVLDATTGQNAISQAKMFHEALDLTGIALTKLDGTAKGGIVVSIINTLNVPLKYIGVGEDINDLQIFNTKKFVDALFE